MDEELKKLLEKNVQLTEEVLARTEKIESYIHWQKIFSVLKLLIILIPVILGIIYLPPLLSNIFEQYKSLLGIDLGNLFNMGGSLQNIDLKGLNLNDIDSNLLP